MGWDGICDYSRGKAKPSREIAKKAFDELLENIKLENCVYFPDVVNAMLRRVPGKVEAENYGHEGADKSFYVKDTSQKAEYYRIREPVLIGLIGERDRADPCRVQNRGQMAKAKGSHSPLSD